MFKYISIALMLLISFAVYTCDDSNDPEVDSGPRGRSIEADHTAVLYDGESEVTSINIAMARTESERSTGLMDVQEMPFDTGMLFLFNDEQPRSFWMVNTPLSLDIIFLNSDQEIVRIRTNTTPYSERQITSEVPAQYVLEVNSGFAREYDIREGMRLEWE